jgi:hypothetical protein
VHLIYFESQDKHLAQKETCRNVQAIAFTQAATLHVYHIQRHEIVIAPYVCAQWESWIHIDKGLIYRFVIMDVRKLRKLFRKQRSVFIFWPALLLLIREASSSNIGTVIGSHDLRFCIAFPSSSTVLLEQYHKNTKYASCYGFGHLKAVVKSHPKIFCI